MAGDIWRDSRARRKCSELVLLLRPIVLTFWLSTSLLQHGHAASDISARTGPSTDFRAHSLFRPKIFHGRSKREILNTRENGLQHADSLTVGFEVDGIERILDLRLNTDLIPVGFKHRRQHLGEYKTETPETVELCQYQGSVRGIPDSWVAVSTCHGLRGVIFDGENMHHIHPETESLDSLHYLYNHNDLTANHTCGYKGTTHEVIPPRIDHNLHRSKRAAEAVRGPYNANRQSRYVELVLVIDKKEYIALGQNLDKVHHHCKDIANIMNALYTPLNIFVALVGVEVWTENDAITLSSKGDTTLANFLRYRREILVKSMPNDNAQLLTRIHFEDGVVGKALKGPICTYEFSGGVSMDHSNVIGLVAATVAHEMGHNFGMEHDTADCDCPDDRCIMAPSSGATGPTHWSSCSLEYLSLAFEHGMDYCLRNKPKKLFGRPICGNGFVESGEQCDCGLQENCNNPCCNATTCMLHSNASCATGECCDFKTCRPKNAGTECRSAEHECDLPEYCSGQGEYCPSDVFKIDGEICNVGKAFCYQGSCRTHNDQCRLLWGPTGFASDHQCYDMNSRGTKHGNCGFNRLQSSFVKCQDTNVLCGMLHCGHYNERLEFGMESVAVLSHSFINNGGAIIACRSAIVDLGLNQVDPGLAPDGAKCAAGKMCVNQKCMPIQELRAGINHGHACPNNCGGNGVCNSRGHCHCNKGFRPPDCIQPGYGGSDDSGPAEDPNGRSNIITALYVIFLGILPICVLVYLVHWFKKGNMGRPAWKKDAISTLDRGFTIKTIDRPGHHGFSRGIETIDSTLAQDPACASLLSKSDNDERFNNSLFGQFKGFTLTPLQPTSLQSQTQKPLEPTKPAPPPPTVPTVVIKTNIKPVQRSNTIRSAFMSQPLSSVFSSSSHGKDQPDCTVAPALPPLNPGCTARPLISSPILSATTCTSMELITGHNIPTRPAPQVPVRPPETLGALSTTLLPQRASRPNSLIEIDKKGPEKEKEKSSTLNRIASILRPSGIVRSLSQSVKDDKSESLSRTHSHHQRANKVIDKEILRNLEISNPILQNEVAVVQQNALSQGANSPIGAIENEKQNVVMRAQSMRDAKKILRPAIQTFGSMRQANSNKRPTSIPASVRPTSPPPPVPPTAPEKSNESLKIPGLPGYQNPPVKISANVVEDTYDDCMNIVQDSALTKIMEEPHSSDNIYAVIEEPLPNAEKLKKLNESSEYKVPKPIENSEGSDPMGLLSEIVSEISNRNFDSIYSGSSVQRKKKEKENSEHLGSSTSLGTYANSNHYKSPESVYSNSPSGKFDSAVSETSSGYLLPSAVNVPRFEEKPRDAKVQKSQTKTPEKRDNKKVTKSDGSKSVNPNLNDELSKVFGMKSAENPVKSSSSVLSRQNVTKKEDNKKELTAKPPLSRTKTPPHIVKSSSKEDSDLKSQKNPEVKTVRQGSDTSLKSNKSQAGKERKDSIGSPQKNVPSSPTKSKNNSPDVVSSCSSSTITSESPDVLGNNGRIAAKSFQKTPVSTKPAGRNPTMPPKPSNIVIKAATFAERKKSPTGNTNVIKSLSTAGKEVNKPSQVGKSEIKTNPIQKANGIKSNVASLQQKFEQNKTAASNSVKNTSVRKTGVDKTEFNLKK